MQAKSAEFSRPEIHPHLAQSAPVVTPCGIGFVRNPVVLCSSGPEGGWSPFARATDRCLSRDQLQGNTEELHEPVDLSLHRNDDVDQSSSSTASRQHPASHGRPTNSPHPQLEPNQLISCFTNFS